MKAIMTLESLYLKGYPKYGRAPGRPALFRLGLRGTGYRFWAGSMGGIGTIGKAPGKFGGGRGDSFPADCASLGECYFFDAVREDYICKQSQR